MQFSVSFMDGLFTVKTETKIGWQSSKCVNIKYDKRNNQKILNKVDILRLFLDKANFTYHILCV